MGSSDVSTARECFYVNLVSGWIEALSFGDPDTMRQDTSPAAV